MLFADGANHLARLAVGSDGQYLGVSSGVPAWQSTPGNDTYVLFNDGGAFGGDSRFIWNKATSGGLSVTAPDGAVDPASIGGRTDFVSGNGGDNIDQYYTGSQFSLTGGDGDEQRGGSIGGAAGSSVIDGDGGPVSFQAGNGGTNSGSGGPVSLIAGDAQGGDGDGGNIQIQSGDKNGSGDSGYVLLSTPNNEKQLYLQEGYGFAIYTGGSANALLSASDLNSDRTFSFPDHEGAFVISTTTPTTASDTCSPGQVSYSSTHFYVCVATDTWKRAALSTF
nr:hypothetical protein [uncultured bacterium]